MYLYRFLVGVRRQSNIFAVLPTFGLVAMMDWSKGLIDSVPGWK